MILQIFAKKIIKVRVGRSIHNPNIHIQFVLSNC